MEEEALPVLTGDSLAVVLACCAAAVAVGFAAGAGVFVELPTIGFSLAVVSPFTAVALDFAGAAAADAGRTGMLAAGLRALAAAGWRCDGRRGSVMVGPA